MLPCRLWMLVTVSGGVYPFLGTIFFTRTAANVAAPRSYDFCFTHFRKSSNPAHKVKRHRRNQRSPRYRP